MQEVVSKTEYDQHKRYCGNSFDNLNRAIYGDPKNGTPGMLKQMTEIHELFFSLKATSNVLLKIFVGISFLVGLVYGLVKLWKEIK
jgi:hypothetical protein